MKNSVLLSLVMLIALVIGTSCMKEKVVLFDMSHGKQGTMGIDLIESYRGFVEKTPNAVLEVNGEEITASVLKNADVLIVLTPIFPSEQLPTFTQVERSAIVEFAKSGGRIMVVAEEERRTLLEEYGINDIVTPFGLEYGEACPVRDNVGAIGLQGKICQERRELPYSGGRIINGGTALSIVNDEGGYQHMAYVELKNGGKVMAAGDAMALLLLSSAEGQPLSGMGGARGDAIAGAPVTPGTPGTRGGPPPAEGERSEGAQQAGQGPAAGQNAVQVTPGGAAPAGGGSNFFARFWGKDSHIFKEEVVTWLLE
ncbi:MAG: hypothetical protein JXB19_10970 [Bacteroidales bacterium]|nr:hypothetical protein [Bacteroidales bacterium]